MKIITFWGGLGNQLFEYAYYIWLKSKFPNKKIYAFYPAIGLAAHNGLEIDKRFNVNLPKTSIIANIIGHIIFNLNRILRRLKLPLWSTCTSTNCKYNRIFHCDYWQNKKYILDTFDIDFKLGEISIKNQQLIDLIHKKDVVSVHIRRGDYLDSKNVVTYGGICTDIYYKKVFSEVENKVENPFFLFFSDDPHFIKEHYHYENMIIVDWNKKEDSIWDMYLMSKCSYMVLANSTFSYWAARLNKNAKIVWCPNKWTNVNEPDIIDNKWIKVTGI